MTHFMVEQDERGVVLTAINSDDSMDVFALDPESAKTLAEALYATALENEESL